MLVYSTVNCPWRCYGTSGVESIPQGQPMRKALIYRASDDYYLHAFYKSIVQPKYVTGSPSPHDLYCHTLPILEFKKVDLFRINHYWSRDKEFFHGEKIRRYMKWNGNLDTILGIERAMNAVYDPILF